MYRLFLFLLAAWFFITLLKRQKRNLPYDQNVQEKTDDMVACAVCGVHTPKTEAISSQNLYYCCEAHFLARPR